MIPAGRRDSRNGERQGRFRDPGRRSVSVGLGILGLVSLVSAQSLVEAARMEKARRATYKDKPVIMVTNKDLHGSSSGPEAVADISSSEASGDLGTSAASEAPAAAPSEPIILAAPPPPGGVSRRSVSPGPVSSLQEDDLSTNDPARIQSEMIWQQAKERADNLEIKIGEYTQDYYASRDRSSRLALEKQIGEMTERYNRARDEEARAWVQMDRMNKIDNKDN